MSVVRTSKNESLLSEKYLILEAHGYHLTEKLGSGSFSDVYMAKGKNKEVVAVKIIDKSVASQKYINKFLVRELQVVRGIIHPNVIRYLQAIETSARFYIIMEYAENRTILEFVQKNRFAEEPQANIWFRELVEAVEYCHKHAVVHRDIKCENLLLDKNNSLKLTDFGFARAIELDKQGKISLSSTYCGSKAYASPEILRGKPYNPILSDIWAMGVVLYSMVVGMLPFDDSDFVSLLKQTQSKVLFPASPSVSPECRSLIRSILVSARRRLAICAIKTNNWYTGTKSNANAGLSSNEGDDVTDDDVADTYDSALTGMM